MKRINQILILLSLLVLAEYSFAKKLYLIENTDTNTNLSIESKKSHIKTEIKRVFPEGTLQTTTASAKTDDVISISFGIDSLKESIINSDSVDIATFVTQTEIKALKLKYPEALTSTSIVFNGSLFQCQLDFYKNLIPKDDKSKLGVLLFQDSRLLLPDIESYAKQHLINIEIFMLQNNESVIRGLHNLLIKHPTVMLLADSEVDQVKNLNGIFYEAKLSNRKIIAATHYQKKLGAIGPCAFNDKEITKNIIQIIKNKLN